MSSHEDGFQAPRFDGEDVSPTTQRELRGWYCTGLAAEIFGVCGVGSFVPVTLEQLARESGVLRSDHTTPCIEAKDTAIESLARLLTRAVTSKDEDLQCIIRPFGRDMATSSFAMYTSSIAVFVQALVLISFSPVADYGSNRKRLVFTFAFTGATATMAFLLVQPKVYLLASLFTIIAVICLGSLFVLLNAFLPQLAARHPSVTHNTHPPDTHTSPALKLSTQISANGVVFGCGAGVSVQLLSILLLVLLKKYDFAQESTPLRCVLFMVGVWWFSLTIPGALWLRNRPGPSLSLSSPLKTRLPIAVQYLTFAWRSVWQTVKTASKLRQTTLFLAAWFLLSDAVATIMGTSILFARTELEMGMIPIAILSITGTTSAMFGAFAWPRIAKRYNMDTKHTILTCVALMEIIPLYGLLGLIPFVKSWGFLGLQQVWEFYPLAFIQGFLMGGLASYSRAWYGEIIPPGSEAAFYALMAITDKGSSAVGPAIVGAIVDAVGTIRPAFGFLAVLMLTPMPLIYMIDARKGKEEAVALSKAIGYGPGESFVMEDFDLDSENEAGAGLLGDNEEDEEWQRAD